MIKGNSRHVIVIKKTDDKYFEEAFFIVKKSLFRSSGKTEEEIMHEARLAAENYMKKMKSEDLIYR
jgi:hypothetical protein